MRLAAEGSAMRRQTAIGAEGGFMKPIFSVFDICRARRTASENPGTRGSY